jgi:hypothetical protein
MLPRRSPCPQGARAHGAPHNATSPMHTPLALPAQRTVRSDLRGLSTEIVTTIAGIIAAIAMVALNVASQRALDLDILGLTYAFVLPAGAILGGLGAAGGYYVAARITSTLPSRRTLFEMLAIGVSTWLLMHWVDYVTLRFDNGTLIRDAVPFADYLRLRAEHLQLTIQGPSGTNGTTTPELGLLGYVHELLQVAGFLVGGLMTWIFLKRREACTPCSRYAHTLPLLQRAPSAAFDEVLRRANVQLDGLAERVARVVGAKQLVGLNLSIATCPSCRRSWLRPGAVVMEGRYAAERRIEHAYAITAAQAAALRLASPVRARAA